jgi:hypothetical protein
VSATHSIVDRATSTLTRCCSRRGPGELTASDAAPSLERGETRGLARALEAHGAHVELLVDGSLVATLVDARGAATDQAAQAARCALLAHRDLQRPCTASGVPADAARIARNCARCVCADVCSARSCLPAQTPGADMPGRLGGVEMLDSAHEDARRG